MKRPRTNKRVTALKMERAERHHAEAAALIAGATKLLSDFVNGTSWGTEIALDVSIRLLANAKEQDRLARMAVK